MIWYCCDRKTRAACAQDFALWQQATIEFTWHDHSIIACSRHIYVWCCSSGTSRSWWIRHLTQHHRRGCNNIPSFSQRTARFCVKADPGTTFTYWSQHHFVAIGNPERHVRKASHCGSKQQYSSHAMIILLLLVRATHMMVLFFRHIPFVVNHTFNATPPERLQQ